MVEFGWRPKSKENYCFAMSNLHLRDCTMAFRFLTFCLVVGAFIFSDLPFDWHEPAAAQTTVKKKKQKVQQRDKYPIGLKNYPWGEPTAGWSDRCVFFFDTYDGWIPPECRPYGR
jgi:hypothetical protein